MIINISKNRDSITTGSSNIRSVLKEINVFAIIFLAVTLVFFSASDVVTTGKVSAQMSNNNITGTIGSNETMMTIGNISRDIGRNITSSVGIVPTLVSALMSQANVSLVQATTNAEKAVSDSSHGVLAMLNAQNGYLVYTVWVLDESYNVHQVIVDPGNGEVLAQKIALVGPVFLDPNSMGIMNPGSMVPLG